MLLVSPGSSPGDANGQTAFTEKADMPKFYVDAGAVRLVLSADGEESAALAAIERCLQGHLWIFDDPDLSAEDCRTHLMLEALLHLPPVVRVSQRGFDRTDAVELGTPELVDRWHRLMVGMGKLFAAAGLLPRPVAAMARIETGTTIDLDSGANPGLPR